MAFHELKIKKQNCLFKFLIKHNNVILKITLSFHPDNRFRKRETIDESEYNNFGGEIHTYDGNSSNLLQILDNYNLEDDYDDLFLRLWAEADLEETGYICLYMVPYIFRIAWEYYCTETNNENILLIT